MRRGNASGRLVVAVMAEAARKFGEPRTWNREVVTAWVQARVRELREQAHVPAEMRPHVPRGFNDAKQRQCGDDE